MIPLAIVVMIHDRCFAVEKRGWSRRKASASPKQERKKGEEKARTGECSSNLGRIALATSMAVVNDGGTTPSASVASEVTALSLKRVLGLGYSGGARVKERSIPGSFIWRGASRRDGGKIWQCR